MSYAKLCKHMQGTEIIDAMLVLLRKKPKITNKELSLNLRLHRNTVSKYRKIIRRTYYKTPEEIVNKIDSRLEEDLEAMVHRDLIAYRRAITPQKIEAKTEHKETIKKELIFKLEDMPKDEREFCKRIARKYIKENNQRRPPSIH